MFIALHIFSSKNSWSSPLGGLYFSFNCTCREAKNLPFIQYVICLAVIEIGGILCHSSYSDGVYHVTNGIGLNLNNMVSF
ncbi:unnamed protein product [Bathycoccus prasinos]